MGKAWLRCCLDQDLLPEVALRCSYARGPQDGCSLLLSQRVMPAEQSRLFCLGKRPVALGRLLGHAAVLLILAGASPLWPLAELAGEVSGHSCLFLLCWITVLLLAWQQSYRMKTRQPCISQNEKGIQHLKSRSPMTCLCWTAAGWGSSHSSRAGSSKPPVYPPRISWRTEHGCSLRAPMAFCLLSSSAVRVTTLLPVPATHPCGYITCPCGHPCAPRSWPGFQPRASELPFPPAVLGSAAHHPTQKCLDTARTCCQR